MNSGSPVLPRALDHLVDHSVPDALKCSQEFGMLSLYLVFNCAPWKRASPFFASLQQYLLNTHHAPSTSNTDANTMKFPFRELAFLRGVF